MTIKKLLIPVLIFVLICSSLYTSASASDISIEYNETKLQLTPRPFTLEGAVYLPLNALEALGFNTYFDSTSGKISINGQGVDIILNVGIPEANVSEKPAILKNSPHVFKKTVFIPLEVFDELNFGTHYDKSNMKVDILKTQIENGGFESELTSWSVSKGLADISRDIKISGERALMVKSNGGGKVLASQRIKVIPNTVYNVMFKAMSTENGILTGILNENEKIYLSHQITTEPTGKWTQYQTSFDSGINSYVTVEIKEPDKKGLHYFDDFVIEKSDKLLTAAQMKPTVVKLVAQAEAPKNLVINNGFEEQRNKWDGAWGFFDVTSKKAYTGDFSLFAKSTGEQTYVTVSQEISVKKNTNYKVSFWYLSTNSDLEMDVKDALSKDTLAVYMSTQKVDDWTKVEKTFNTRDCDKIMIHFYDGGHEANNIEGTHYLDDVVIVEIVE